MNSRLIGCALVLSLAACSGGGGSSPMPPVPGGSTPGATVFDESSAACSVSYDGVMWYAVPAGEFSPIDVKTSTCSGALGRVGSPPRPRWAIPHGPTQTRFVATSLQQGDSLAGMQSIEAAAAPHHVPVSWLIASYQFLTGARKYYSLYHHSNGDDVEAAPFYKIIHAMKRYFPWYVPEVSVEGAGHERYISRVLALGEHAFWGITWNSHGTDGTNDYGAPWGSYCADPSSYKRPDPSGACTLLAFEWTARDLTRAYLSGHEEYFSTDPDDLLQRAGFSTSGAQTYVRAVVDAYAAAGETQPIVMVSQQESLGDTAADAETLSALYDRAVATGMKTETMAQAASDARVFSAAPRAVAFPFIAGGNAVPSSIVNGQVIYPATIDFHDALVGMTFLAGHTLPTRAFRYSDDPTSQFNVPLAPLPASLFPTLEKAVSSKGVLALQLHAPVRLHFGIALWASPQSLGITQPGAVPAGRAGEVIVLDLSAGENHVVIKCPGCHGTTLPYST